MKLGEFAEFDSVGKRDAFHVSAVIAVATKEDLSPGESVRFLDTSLKEVEPCIPSARHGIVDPFLKNRVIPGSAVQILLRPDGVTNLSHHFDVNFPGLPVAPAEEESEDYEEYDECQNCY